MASGADIIGAAGQGASIIPALVGRGQNKREANSWGPGQEGYDPNAGFFGGDESGLRGYRAQVSTQRGDADARGAFQTDNTQANWDRSQAGYARNGQQTIADAMTRRALGQVPSIADQQAQRDMARLRSSTASAAASARGPGAVSLAQQNAMGANARGTADISGAAQVAGAQERERAEGNAFGAYSGMRSGDQNAQQLSQQQSQYQTDMQQRNREANDRRAGTYDQLEYQAQRDAMQGRLQDQQTKAQAFGTAESANQRTADQNAQGKGLIDTIGDFFSDERAKYMLSDFTGKVPLMGMGGGPQTEAWAAGGLPGMGNATPVSGMQTYDKLDGSGGMDVLGSLQAHSDTATQYTGDPAGGMMMSDAKAKQDAFEEGVLYADADHFGANKDKYVPDYMRKRRTEARTGESSGAKALVIERKVGQPESPEQEPPSREDLMVRPGSFGAGESMPRQSPATSGGLSTSYFDAPQSTAPSPVPTPAPAATPPANAGILGRVGAFFRSDERTKEQARAQGRSEGLALAGKPRLGPRMAGGKVDMKAEPPGAGQARFVPGRGWVQAGADEADARSASFDDSIASQAAQDTEDATRSRQADEGNALRLGDSNASEAAKIQRGFSNDAEAKKIRASVSAEDEPSQGQPTWLSALGSATRGLNEAQFGRGVSDERAKTKLPPPSDAPLADAARKMEGQPYAYKPEFTPPEQEPGEVNYGFMAQNLEKNPITATAVKEGPDGMKRVDAQKLLKVLSATVSNQQKQIDETRVALAGKRRAA